MTPESMGLSCPFSERTLPRDGTPLRPSPTLDAWRDESEATALHYPDGHEGVVVTGYELARTILSDERFSVAIRRFPAQAEETDRPDEDADTTIAAADLLRLDGAEHQRIRAALLPHFSLRAVRAHSDAIAEIVQEELDKFLRRSQPSDLYAYYATPISARVHRLILGVPEECGSEFDILVTESATQQEKFNFIRRLIECKREHPGSDIVTDLISSDYSRREIEGIIHLLMSAGRDSVAYIIATATVGLLTHPDQLEVLRKEPSTVSGAVEEFLRFGTMFVTLFPRTATEEVTFEDVEVEAGQTVAVSPVAANRDSRRFEDPNSFRVNRDAFGHLGFGYGKHGCVGQQLARLEIRESIAQLISAAPNLRLVDADQLKPMEFAHPVATYKAGRVMVDW